MQRARGAASSKLLDQTISYTQSSFAYKDPYVPNMSFMNSMKNKMQTFSAVRSIENEFVDYESYTVRDQFREIYLDLFKAFRRNDKVILTRSLSSPMYAVSKSQCNFNHLFSWTVLNRITQIGRSQRN